LRGGRDAEIGADQHLLELLEGGAVELALGDEGGDRAADRRRGALEAGREPLPPAFLAARVLVRAVVHAAVDSDSPRSLKVRFVARMEARRARRKSGMGRAALRFRSMRATGPLLLAPCHIAAARKPIHDRPVGLLAPGTCHGSSASRDPPL